MNGSAEPVEINNIDRTTLSKSIIEGARQYKYERAIFWRYDKMYAVTRWTTTVIIDKLMHA